MSCPFRIRTSRKNLFPYHQQFFRSQINAFQFCSILTNHLPYLFDVLSVESSLPLKTIFLANALIDRLFLTSAGWLPESQLQKKR